MKELEKKIYKHLKDRNWHNLRPADIAKSIMIEGAELLELFQWENLPLEDIKKNKEKMEEIKKELADVITYAIEMSVLLGLDTEKIILKKLAAAGKKYPAKLMRERKGEPGSSEDIYWKIKKNIGKIMIKKDRKQMLVVVALIRDKKGRIFLQRRSDTVIHNAHDKWEFPGGKINYGEYPEKAVVRECYEETGFKIKVTKLVPGVLSKIWHRKDGGEQHVVVLCYEAVLIKKVPRVLHRKVSDQGWFFEEEIKKLDVLEGTIRFLKLLEN